MLYDGAWYNARGSHLKCAGRGSERLHVAVQVFEVAKVPDTVSALWSVCRDGPVNFDFGSAHKTGGANPNKSVTLARRTITRSLLTMRLDTEIYIVVTHLIPSNTLLLQILVITVSCEEWVVGVAVGRHNSRLATHSLGLPTRVSSHYSPRLSIQPLHSQETRLMMEAISGICANLFCQ